MLSPLGYLVACWAAWAGDGDPWMEMWAHLPRTGYGGTAYDCVQWGVWHCGVENRLFPGLSSSIAEEGKIFYSFLDIYAGLGNLFALPYCANSVCAACNLINAWSEQLALLLEPKWMQRKDPAKCMHSSSPGQLRFPFIAHIWWFLSHLAP